MPAFLIAGYTAGDLGVFSAKDPKVAVIKKAIRHDLIRLFEEGVDWLIFQGNLGFDYWCLEVARELKQDYDVQLACIFPFANHGQNWSEVNQALLSQFHQLDYVNHSFTSYQTPTQLKQHQDFLLRNSQGAYLFYDDEYPTKLSYLHQAIKERDDYDLLQLDFDRLNELMQDLE